jgi:hypothetical protein
MGDGGGFSAAEAAELAPGDNVCVRALQSRPELVGRVGMVVAALNAATGRVTVQVEGEPAPMALRPLALEGSGLPDGVRQVIWPAAPVAAAPSPAKRRRVSSSSSGGGGAGDGGTVSSISSSISSSGSDGGGGSGDTAHSTASGTASGTANSGGGAGQRKDAEAALFARVHEILSAGDVNTMTLRAVRQQLTPRFGAEFVSENKGLIKRMVSKIIPRLQQGQQQQQAAAGEGTAKKAKAQTHAKPRAAAAAASGASKRQQPPPSSRRTAAVDSSDDDDDQDDDDDDDDADLRLDSDSD